MELFRKIVDWCATNKVLCATIVVSIVLVFSSYFMGRVKLLGGYLTGGAIQGPENKPKTTTPIKSSLKLPGSMSLKKEETSKKVHFEKNDVDFKKMPVSLTGGMAKFVPKTNKKETDTEDGDSSTSELLINDDEMPVTTDFHTPKVRSKNGKVMSREDLWKNKIVNEQNFFDKTNTKNPIML